MNQEHTDRQMIKRPYVFHPILFAIFPTVFLYCYNYGHVTFKQLLIPLGLSMLLVIGVWFGLEILFRDRVQSGVATSLFLLLFFGFGHAGELLPGSLTLLAKYVALLIIWSILFLCFLWWMKRTSFNLLPFSNWLNWVGLILLGIPIAPSDLIAAPNWMAPQQLLVSTKQLPQIENIPKPAYLPDIYYIMVDGYTGQDVLLDVFGYDNRPFLEFLKEKKFYVAERGQANYCQTWLSLSASLNLNYVDQLVDVPKLLASDDRIPLRMLIQHNWVVRFLKNFGYTFVSFESGKAFTDMEMADIVLPRRPVVDEFLETLVQSTPLLGLFYVAKSLEGGRHLPLPSTAYQAHRDRVAYALAHVSTLSNHQAPLFVFAHILAPHPPFVFGPNGESIEPDREYGIGDGSHFFEQGGTVEEYRLNYTGQIQYLNAALISTIQQILDRSDEPPVIILQADHGSRMRLDWNDSTNTDVRESFSIMSALYLPGVEYQAAYNTISPVNTFRLIFNAYFGTEFPILENKSYYSTWERPYQFVDVSDQAFSMYSE
ncbi:MAG: hypothetical protein MRJ96_09965 [Nitrospirales bacterium]|nr:hypothetical protein [Nitrospira sp.]MDR4501762.1 hypothetical protein [Nitrospirales bacterium]